MKKADLQKAIALTLVPKVGPILAKNLIDFFGGLDGVFRAKKQLLLKLPYINTTIANQISNKSTFARAEKEISFINKHDIKCCYFKEETFPTRLQNYADAPILLYYKGTNVLNHKRTIAIVGTRKITNRGRAICSSLIKEFAAYNVCVFSGLAYGVDTEAHKACVANGIPTIGVLGHGLDMIYPAENLRLAKNMIQSGGILSEFVSQTKPEAMHFPQRNRVVAMLSDAVLVIESGASGGSMITADFAFQYNKDVFAIPGHPEDAMSKGCNKLIKDGKAALVDCAKDIANTLLWTAENETARQTQMALAFELNKEETKIVNVLKSTKGVEIDSIHYKTSFPHSKLSSLLLNLEFKGIIKTLPGKKYILS